MARRVLVIDDDEATCHLIAEVLKEKQFEVVTCTRPETALELVGDEDFDVILTDLQMAGMGGIELCERMLGTQPDTQVVVITGHGSMEAAVAAIRVGAFDFLSKPLDLQLLAVAVGRAAEHRALRSEVKRLRLAQVSDPQGVLLGDSKSMRLVNDVVGRVALTEASVLVTGESGTGKELVARGIHQRSNRRAGPFVAVNCAAVSANLIESELFGHVRGAFTDAHQSRVGLFVEATGGTLFLDEVGELPIEMQPKLLRALQERTVRPVGANTEVPYDVRVVAATNRDLEAEIYAKRFREDLYYRLNVVEIRLPPLRERPGDIVPLATHFMTRCALRSGKELPGLSPSAAEKLLAYHWPGNVRELENCIERAVALNRSGQIAVGDLPDKIRLIRSDQMLIASDETTDLVTLAGLEQRYIRRVLSVVNGNKSRAAQIMGLDRRTLYRKLGRFDADMRPPPAESE